MRFDPAHFVFVRPYAIEIGAVRPGEKITRLEEMHMSIDVAGQNEFPVALDPAGTDRDTAFFAAGDALDFVAINYDNRVLNNLAVRRINCGTADEGNFLSKRAGRKRRSYEESSNSIHKGRVSRADSARTIRSASRSSGA